ncbi:MAG: class I SAM-dependent methyltransferase [Sumerlaeia bacterium]
MNVEEYERMYHLEDTYWWFQGRLKMIMTILDTYLPEKPRPGRVLDVGCGTGLMLRTIAEWRPIGFDFSHLALEFSASKGAENLVRGDVVKLPFADESLDLILALDLMEHVERDDLLIREFNRVLRPGGCLMATVPAHQYLWSDHDIALHHFRRYSHKSLLQLLADGGLQPIKYSYGISFVHPGIVAFRMLQRAKQRLLPRKNGQAKAHLIPLPGPLNRAMIGLLHTEASLLRRMNLPQGTSLMTLARKTGAAAPMPTA